MEEKNRHILKKVIELLPSYLPLEKCWDKISKTMNEDLYMEGNRHYLQKAIHDLPQYNPRPELFDKIEKELQELKSKKAIGQLPTHSPSDELWNKIELQLDQKQVRVIPIQQWAKYSLRIAASVILLLGAYWIYHYTQPIKENTEISYSTETVIEPGEEINEIAYNENNAAEFIRTSCLKQPDVCSQPQVDALKTQLDELENEQTRLKESLEQDKDNAELIKSLIKIEKEKTKVSKKLIQYII